MKKITELLQNKKELTQAKQSQQRNALKRLQTLLDVVYALMIFQLFLILPYPTQEQIAQREFATMFAESGTQLSLIVIGVVMVIIYWSQSTQQLGNLSRIDLTVGTLAIVQVFSLLIYLYFINLEAIAPGDVFALAMQSSFLALAGILGIINWYYARSRGYFDELLTPKESLETVYSFFAEPIVALITIPVLLINPDWFTAAWLLLIPISMLINKQKKKKLLTADEH